jgi:hypothetical protein
VGLVLIPLSFTVFGLLLGAQAHGGMATLVGAVGGLLFGLLVVLVAGGVLSLSHAELRARPALIARALSEGAALLLPFAILALVAELGLHWSAVQVFASSGLMASMSASGAAATKHGGKGGMLGTVLPMAAGGVLMVLWMGVGVLLSMMGGRSG